MAPTARTLTDPEPPYAPGGEFGAELRNITPTELPVPDVDEPVALPALAEGQPATATNGRATVMSRLLRLEEALADLHARHSSLLERNLQLEGDLAALKSVVGTAEVPS